MVRRRFSLLHDFPVDPWPRASLGERLSVGSVLILLLAVPFCAAGGLLLVAAATTLHVYRSYGVGASARALLDRRRARHARLGRAPLPAPGD